MGKKRSKDKVKRKEQELLVGKVDLAVDGYGFFIPDNPDLPDVFIPKSKLNGASHKDIVKVQIEVFKGKKEARVVEIIERGYSKIIGRVEKSRFFAYVIPFVKRFGFDIYIPKRYADDLKDDDVVICEITKYPEKNRNPEGKVHKILGNLADKGIENIIVLEKYEIRREFPKSVQKAVKRDVLELIKYPGKREDFRDLFTVTIDGETARDFDDAISIMKTNNGYKLYVHIADVAHFVRAGSKVDKEAYRRGTSIYFPEFAIPMLPEELSNEMCSLKPNVDRLALTVEIDYDDSGNRLFSKFHQSIINSDYRLTYNFVNDLIEKKVLSEDKRLNDLVIYGLELLEKLMSRRKLDGMIDFDLPEVEFYFDDEGDMVDIKPLERKISHRLIEFFMIEANEVVAEFLEKNYNRSMFRVHGVPDADKLKEFTSLCHLYGIDVEDVDGFDPKSIQMLSEKISRSPFGYLLSSMLVRTMQKALYSPDNTGHFGLSSQCYTHFTSPIRRYPDLVVHRLVKRKLFGYNFDYDEEYLDGAAINSSRTEQLAEEAEREIHLYKKLKFLQSHTDAVFDAYINRLTPNGIFVYLDKFLLTGFVSIENMLGDNYYYLESQNIFMGKKKKIKLKLGDRVKVSLFKVNYDYLEADFILVG
ncbi:MAG: ribonuclease R [Calditerrivibrio sp.]|nr:ribonuclease R [Calditerrivibrio sp.]